MKARELNTELSFIRSRQDAARDASTALSQLANFDGHIDLTGQQEIPHELYVLVCDLMDHVTAHRQLPHEHRKGSNAAAKALGAQIQQASDFNKSLED